LPESREREREQRERESREQRERSFREERKRKDLHLDPFFIYEEQVERWERKTALEPFGLQKFSVLLFSLNLLTVTSPHSYHSFSFSPQVRRNDQ